MPIQNYRHTPARTGSRSPRPARLFALLLAAGLWAAAAAPAALAQTGNLISNGSFEAGYYKQDGIPELAVPLNWRINFVDNGTFPGSLPGQIAYRPELVVWNKVQAPEAERGLFWRDGDYTLKVFKPWAPLYSALSQNVSGLQPGATYTFNAYIFVDVVASYDGASKVPPANDAEHDDDVQLRLGVGSVGAAWRDETTIRYMPWVNAANRPYFHQSSVPLTYTFQATAPQMSVWIEMQSVAGYINNGFFVDGVTLTPGGTGAVVPAAPAATPSGAKLLGNSTTYKVVAGDSLYKIAKKVGVPVDAIIRANNLADPRLIRPGQTLIIPDPSKFYRVKQGDTLGGIALQFGTSAAVLQSLNNLSGTVVYTGQVLILP